MKIGRLVIKTGVLIIDHSFSTTYDAFNDQLRRCTLKGDIAVNIDKIQQVWKSYLDAYGDVPATERDRLLKYSVSEDVSYTNPTGEGRGLNALLDHTVNFQKQMPGAYFTSNKLITHHGELLSEWTMYKKDGAAVATAHTFARINEQGLLTYIAGFFETPKR